MPDVKIASLEGSEFSAYFAEPSTKHGSGLIVIHDRLGIDAAVRKLCDDYAAHGYLVVCPDIFWRLKPGAQFSGEDPDDLTRAAELARKLDIEAAVRDLLSTLGHIRKMEGCSGKVGALGFGLGGRLAYLMAARSDVDATVSYYPTDLEKNLDEYHDVRTPLLIHFAALDEISPVDKSIRMLHNFARNPVIMARVYEKVGHGFALEGGKNYNKETADLAGGRARDFLAERLIIN
jgi:carboxymethylenebutenolidase